MLGSVASRFVAYSFSATCLAAVPATPRCLINTPAKLRAWKSASHVERAQQREKKPEPPAPTPPPAA
jgi:hypothetical protein